MKCPGQDWRYWREDAIFEIKCPYCNEKIEFFKDDTKRKCPNCKKVVPNPKMDFGCAAYCKYAQICLGELPPELISEKANLLKIRLLSILESLLDKETYASLIKEATLLEEALKIKEKSSGLLLLTYYFYFLSSEIRKEVHNALNLPEILREEIKTSLEALPTGLNMSELRELILKKI